jgi:hypothetical protein
LQESSESELLCYPVLIDCEPGEILENMSESMDSEATIMESFYTELTNEIEVKIAGRKEARKLKLTQYGDIYQRFKNCWSEIIDINNLRLILLDEKNEERLS